MAAPLKNFLNNYRLTSGAGSAYTHTGNQGELLGSYYISEEGREEFMKLYKDAMESGAKMGLTEKQRDCSPIFIDFDFKQSSADRLYEKKHIHAVFLNLLGELKKYVSFDEESISCYVLEKSAPRKAKNDPYKDGFHMQFPELVIPTVVQHIVRDNILSSNVLDQIFTDVKFLNGWNDVYDSAVIDTNPLLMYGSTKEGGEAYKVSYALIGEEGMELECTEEDSELVEILSIRNKFEPKRVLDSVQEEVQRYAESKKKTIVKEASSVGILKDTGLKNIETVVKLVQMLSFERSDDRKKWFAVGACLHNIDVSLLPLWIEFSKLSPKFKEGECEGLWSGFKEGITIGSLHFWAREDSPEEYLKADLNGISKLMSVSLNASHYDIARVVHKMYQFQYVCVKDDKNNAIWYQFKNHRWTDCEGGTDLRLKLSTEVSPEYMRASVDSRRFMAASEDSKGDSEADIFKSISLKLKNNTFKNAIMKECADQFKMSAKEFTWILDEKPNLLGFNNGVYDLDRMEFRDGRPSDFLTFNTNINYSTQSDPIRRTELMALLHSILNTDEMVKYMLQNLAYFLHDTKNLEKVFFWAGKGGNGKGLLMTLMMTALGDYYYSPSVSVFISGKKTNSSAANPDIAGGKGKRIWNMTEPSPGEKLNTAEIKQKSGNDPIQARGLYQKFMEWVAQFGLLFQMNVLLSLDSYDGGTARRIELQKFMNQFVDNPTRPNERPIDRSLKAKFQHDKSYAEEFMRLLIETHVDVKKNGRMPTPQSVIDDTKDYMDANNVVGGFLEETYDITNNELDILKAGDMYLEFKQSPQFNGMNQKGFKDQMATNGWIAEKITQRGPFCMNSVYKGLRSKFQDSETVFEENEVALRDDSDF